MAFPQHAFRAIMSNSSTLTFGTTTQSLEVGISSTVTLTPTDLFGGGSDLDICLIVKDGTNQLVTSGVRTLVTWASATVDTLTIFDNTNDRITPNAAGKWLFLFAEQIVDGTDGMEQTAWIQKNGTTDITAKNHFQGAAGTEGMYLFVVSDMNGSTDYVDCDVRHQAGVDKNLSGSNAQTYLLAVRLAS